MENIKQYIGRSLLCTCTDKEYAITKGNEYRINDVIELKGKIFFKVINNEEKEVGFKEGGIYFLSIKESRAKIMENKLNRIMGDEKLI